MCIPILVHTYNTILIHVVSHWQNIEEYYSFASTDCNMHYNHDSSKATIEHECTFCT